MLYNKALKFPYWLKPQIRDFFIGVTTLKLSHHLNNQQGEEWRREYNVEDITFDLIYSGEVVEAEVIKNKLVKVLVRAQYNERYDIIMPIIKLNNETVLVKTIWLNNRKDNHKTLDTLKYVKVG